MRQGAGSDWFCSVEMESWLRMREAAASLDGWIFRGSSDAEAPLETTLYRATGNGSESKPQLAEWEDELLRQFQRRAHHYVSDPPRKQNHLEWLSLIQHHGGPTRLLDFSQSFYIATFFAIEKAKNRPAAVWGINHRVLSRMVADAAGLDWPPLTRGAVNHNHIDLLNDYLTGKREPRALAVSVVPERMNERLSIQQGLFLAPCDVTVPFERNLAATFGFEAADFRGGQPSDWSGGDLPAEAAILRFHLPAELHRDALKDLHAMNVTSTSLFPGLDGFARSLYHEIRILDEAGAKPPVASGQHQPVEDHGSEH